MNLYLHIAFDLYQINNIFNSQIFANQRKLTIFNNFKRKIKNEKN